MPLTGKGKSKNKVGISLTPLSVSDKVKGTNLTNPQAEAKIMKVYE